MHPVNTELGDILLVEDDPQDVELTLAALEEHNLANKVFVIDDGEDALDYLYRRGKFKLRTGGNPVVILLDNKMPKMSGLEVLKLVKADEHLKIIPVVVLTSSRETPDLIEFYKHGVNAYVVKPVDFSEFVKAIKQLGLFWAAVNEPPPYMAWDKNPTPTGEAAAPERRVFKMKSPLRILHLEDDPNDAALIRSALESGGVICAITGAENRAGFVAALERGGIDLILSDFSLPEFDGMSALEIVRTGWPAIPFIFVSGTLGEELAIDSLKSGATDYVLKERLSRLVPAVWRAMTEVEAFAEHRRMEAQFIEAQKMEVVGQLAGGVAHDFNNILAVIMGYGELIQGKLDAGGPLHEYVEEILHASERAAALTRQLLVFSSKQAVQAVVLDLNDVVRDTDKMLRRVIDENIELTIVFGREIGHVKADAGYVGQVLMNLVVNARDAMPNGGKLTIETCNVALEGAHGSIVPVDYVMLSVSDTGTGMTDEVKAHLFEAFFTTKPKGKGTGLGLATCQTIADQCGGHIDVQSELGKGTTFKVYFPRVNLPLHISPEFIRKGLLPSGTETLLLVEDEPSVRHLASNILESLGYTVLRASNGQDGLHAASEHKGAPISLVVTDVIMPMMNGKVMAEWLKTTYPDIKVLFTSGYMDDTIASHGVLEPGVAFLAKPYTPAMLAGRVREMLDSEIPERGSGVE